MIKVIITKENNNIKEITLKGHALYADLGKDIVCAAVSSIVITTVNAIKRIDSQAISYEDNGSVLIKILKHDEITNKLTENLADLLKELANDYPKNIKIL